MGIGGHGIQILKLFLVAFEENRLKCEPRSEKMEKKVLKSESRRGASSYYLMLFVFPCTIEIPRRCHLHKTNFSTIWTSHLNCVKTLCSQLDAVQGYLTSKDGGYTGMWSVFCFSIYFFRPLSSFLLVASFCSSYSNRSCPLSTFCTSKSTNTPALNSILSSWHSTLHELHSILSQVGQRGNKRQKQRTLYSKCTRLTKECCWAAMLEACAMENSLFSFLQLFNKFFPLFFNVCRWQINLKSRRAFLW